MKKKINITIDDKMHDKAKTCAKSLGISVSAFISILIAEYK